MDMAQKLAVRCREATSGRQARGDSDRRGAEGVGSWSAPEAGATPREAGAGLRPSIVRVQPMCTAEPLCSPFRHPSSRAQQESLALRSSSYNFSCGVRRMKERLGDSDAHVIIDGSCPYLQSSVAPDDVPAAVPGERTCLSRQRAQLEAKKRELMDTLAMLLQERDTQSKSAGNASVRGREGRLERDGVETYQRVSQRIRTVRGRPRESQPDTAMHSPQAWLPRTGSFHKEMHCKQRQADDKSEYVVKLEFSGRGPSDGKGRSHRKPTTSDACEDTFTLMRPRKHGPVEGYEDMIQRMRRSAPHPPSSRQEEEREGRSSVSGDTGADGGTPLRSREATARIANGDDCEKSRRGRGQEPHRRLRTRTDHAESVKSSDYHRQKGAGR